MMLVIARKNLANKSKSLLNFDKGVCVILFGYF